MHDAFHISIDSTGCPTSAQGVVLRARPRQKGMTLFELLLTGAAISIVLSVFVGVSESLVSDSAKGQTAAVLRTLNGSLLRYHGAHGVWPSASADQTKQTGMSRCLAALRTSPETERLVDGLPGLKRIGQWYTIVDGFGREMVYVDPKDTSEENMTWVRRFPRSRNDRPFVASAGEDGQFGVLASSNLDQSRLAADNLYSFEYMELAP